MTRAAAPASRASRLSRGERERLSRFLGILHGWRRVLLELADGTRRLPELADRAVGLDDALCDLEASLASTLGVPGPEDAEVDPAPVRNVAPCSRPSCGS